MRFLTRVGRLPESLRSSRRRPERGCVFREERAGRRSRSDSLSCGMLFDRMRRQTDERPVPESGACFASSAV